MLSLFLLLSNMLAPIASAHQAINFAGYAVAKVVHVTRLIGANAAAALAMQSDSTRLSRVEAPSTFFVHQEHVAAWAVRCQAIGER